MPLAIFSSYIQTYSGKKLSEQRKLTKVNSTMERAERNMSGKYKEDKDQNELTMFHATKIVNIIQFTPHLWE